jgi:hypothetical protein
LMQRHSWRPLDISLRSACFTDEAFLWQRAKHLVLDYAQVPDYHNCQPVRWQIKRICSTLILRMEEAGCKRTICTYLPTYLPTKLQSIIPQKTLIFTVWRATNLKHLQFILQTYTVNKL